MGRDYWVCQNCGERFLLSRSPSGDCIRCGSDDTEILYEEHVEDGEETRDSVQREMQKTG